jgi:DNA adenine methylase
MSEPRDDEQYPAPWRPGASLVAPFPWFGGKRDVAEDVWAALGPCVNYVEPFFGSGAVLLARPGGAGRVETVNDANRYLANFWRAVAAEPDAVAAHADWPVNEADLTARHWWLLTEGAARIARCDGDPDFHDAQVAGWWVWGACAWIGSGWCSGEGPWVWDGGWLNRKMPHVGNAGQGLNRQMPHVGDAGQGLNRKMPHLSAGQGRSDFIRSWLASLAGRMRHVRVACGDWSRVCGDSVTWRHGLTGVFLDPPYGVEDRATVYSDDDRGVAAKARQWAIEAAAHPLMRIVFAGYAGEHEFPGWRCVEWKARGGYGSQGETTGRANAGRERLWFSPHCQAAVMPDLFRDAVA